MKDRDAKGRFTKGNNANPKGRPKDGESWSAVIKALGDMYPADIIDFIGKDNDLGRMIAGFPKNVQMKYLVTARVFAALMFEPTSGLWNGLMERAEGKVMQPVDLGARTIYVTISNDGSDKDA